MLFFKHSGSFLNSLELWISLTVFIRVNVDGSVNLTGGNGRLDALLCKMEKNI